MSKAPKGFVPAEPLAGKRVEQVAKIITALQTAEGGPVGFDALCEEAGIKYPSDILAAMAALELVEGVSRYKKVSAVKARDKDYYVWVGSANPTLAS